MVIDVCRFPSRTEVDVSFCSGRRLFFICIGISLQYRNLLANLTTNTIHKCTSRIWVAKWLLRNR
ncbi:hypothetical protein COOONC_12019 [Cooperia oncophora]